MKCVLAIAGSDSSGGAGIQADIKTITGLGAHALTVLTAVTAQNSFGISGIHPVPAASVSDQLEAILADGPPQAVKIGMLYSRSTVKQVAHFLKRHGLSRVVVDPLIQSSTGGRLLHGRALGPLRDMLLPLAEVITPNLFEAGILTGMSVETPRHMAKAAKTLQARGPHVVITGGHLKGNCLDLLYDGDDFHEFAGARIDTPHTHGTGCVFSTALAFFLAEENDIVGATKMAHDYTRHAIREGYAWGRGAGPVRPGVR